VPVLSTPLQKIAQMTGTLTFSFFASQSQVRSNYLVWSLCIKTLLANVHQRYFTVSLYSLN